MYSDHLSLARPLEDQHVVSPIDSEFCHPEVELFASSVKAGMNDQGRPTGAVAVHQTQVAREGGILERNADRPDEAAGEVCRLHEAVMALLPGGHNPRIVGIDVHIPALEELEVELLILKYRSRNVCAVHLISSCGDKRCDQQAQKYNLAEPESEKRMIQHNLI